MDFNALLIECAPWVAPKTMAAIVKTESQFNPLAINVNGGAKLLRQPISKQEAVVTAKWLIANRYNIDMGLGQVNSANLVKTNLSIEDAFDPCKNIAAAATILQWNYQAASKKIPGEQAALHAAISAYNTGSFSRGFNNGYVQKVLNNAPAKNGAVKPNATVAPIPLVRKNPEQKKPQQTPAGVKQQETHAYKPKVVKQPEPEKMETGNINPLIYSYPEHEEQRPNVMVY